MKDNMEPDKTIDEIIEETDYLNQKVYIKQKPEVSLYQAVKNILNTAIDETDSDSITIITRQEVINQLFEDYNYYERPLARYSYPTGAYLYSLATLDNIRNMLEKVGYLDKVYYRDKKTNQRKIKLGTYKINNYIPDELSYNQLRKKYNKCDFQAIYEKQNKILLE